MKKAEIENRKSKNSKCTKNSKYSKHSKKSRKKTKKLEKPEKFENGWMDGKWDILTHFPPLWNVSFMKPFSRFLAFLATAIAALFYALLPNSVKRRVFLLHWVHNGANKRTEKDQRVVKLRFSWLTFWTRHFYFTFIITTFAVGKSNYISVVLVYEAIDCLLSSLMWCQRSWEDDLMSFGRISKYLNSEETVYSQYKKVIRK